MESVTLLVSGMTCNHCRMRVEKTLRELDGVENATVALESGQAEVLYEPAKISLAALKDAVTEAGYTVA